MASIFARYRLRPASLALVAVSCGAACLQGARAPNVAPTGTLAPKSGEAAGGETRPFGVVFGSPKGQTESPSEVTLVFNRPMRPLDLAGQEAPSPAKMKPDVPGRWQWVGTNALQFVPKTSLPRATAFEVEVPAGTRAMDGSTLDKPYVLRFSTARPDLVSTQPYEGSEHLDPTAPITVRFNQPVSDAELSRALHLSAEGKPVGFSVKRPEADNHALAQIVPKTKLPLDAPVELRMDGSLRGEEGPLSAKGERSFSYRTFGPLLVRGVDCSRDTPHKDCDARGGFSIELSNDVPMGALKKALSIDPPVKIVWPSWMSDEQPTSRLPVMGKLSPGKTYRVRLASGPRDVYGQPLAKPWASAVKFDDLWPTAEIGLRGTYFEPKTTRAIPVASINVPKVELAVAPLDESGLLSLAKDDGRRDFDAFAALPSARVSSYAPSAAVNAVATHLVDAEAALGGKGKRGAIAVAVRYDTGEERRGARSDSSIADVTDLGITAKVSLHGSLVWVTRLSTGAPVAGASVSIRRPDGPADVFRTDAQGFASIPEQAFRPKTNEPERAIVFVRTDDDFAFRRVAEMLDGYRYGASVDLGEDHPFGMIFSDRGIYRPGDTVKLKGIVREEGYPRTTTPSGRVVRVKVEGPSGEAVTEVAPKLSAFGTFAVDAKIPETGKLGTYSVEAYVDGSPRTWADVSATFEVAEYRPAEFEVGVESDKPSYVRGDDASWTARGDFLFGAPMAGADVSFRVTRAMTSFSPPGLDGYTTSDEPYYAELPDQSPREYEIATSDGKLDDKGLARIAAKLAMAGQRGPEEVTCEASVTDLSRQMITGGSTAIVHPASFYLALSLGDDYFVAAGKDVSPRVLAVDPKGARVASVPVRLDLVERRWQVAKQETGRGEYHSELSPVDKVVASCSATSSSSQPASCALRVPSAGYYLVRATATDGRKNPVAASSSLYGLGEGEVSWADGDKQSIDIVPDKKSYEVGQTARLLVKSPFRSAEALVTVERAGIYSKRVVTLSGPTPTIEVPITEDLRPNAFVSVLLVRGRSKAPPARGGADVGAPAFRLGYGELRVDPESRRLRVAVATNKTDYKPGEEANVDVTVRDRAGKPAKAELTLYAVDEGVLSLIGYRTPDPLPVFAAPRALGVATIESRSALARIVNPYADLGLDKGLAGGGGGEGADVRRDFRPSAFYAASIVTDAEGKAHASFKLPDSLTTYRVMAVAVGEDDRFGYDDERITASRKLMARPAFPRVLRAGDDLEAGVIVTSKGMEDAEVDVELVAQGIQAKETKKRVTVPKNGSVEVRFPLVASTVGSAKLRFRAQGGGQADTVEITRKVLPPIVPEAVALYGDTTTASADKLGDLGAIRSDVGGLEVSLASTALVGLGDGVDQLVEYPYGCTEQLASRLVPLLPLRDLAKDLALPMPPDVDKLVRVTVARILKNQRGDGGFGLWGDSPDANPWVTTYALWSLSEARRRKEPVPESALTGATSYLRRKLEVLDDPLMRATAPFVLDVLAENGEPDPGRVTRLFEQRKELPVFSQALLLHAMVLSKSDRKSIDELADELEGHVRLDGPNARAVVNEGNRYAVLMDSEARTSAMILRGLLAARPAHPLASKLAMGLLADRRGGTWRSTQETAWALLALDAYRKVQEKVTPDFEAHVFLGDAELFHADFRGRTTAHPRTEVPASRLASAGGAALAFSVDGSGRLFYEARLRYARKDPPKTPLDRGFFVKKTLRPVTAGDLANALASIPESSVAAYQGGDLVLADVVVVTPSPREFVVIDDPLPAGFEAIDARLATTGSAYDVDAVADRSGADEPGDDDDVDDARAMGRAVNPSWFLREVRDERVLFFVDHMAAGMYHYRYLARATSIGHFVLPPTRAEQMYVPEVFGRSPAGSITIAAK